MDAAVLVLTGLVCVASTRGVAGWVVHATTIMAIAATLGTILLFVLPRIEPVLANCAVHSPLRRFASTGVREVAGEFLQGMRSLQEAPRACRFAGLTILIWLLDACAAVTVARALDLSLSLHTAFLLLAALGLSSAAPSTPGYIGIYQFVAVTVLMPLGFTRTHALAYILLYQGVLYCVVLFWGGIFAWRFAGIRFDRRWRSVTDSDSEAGKTSVTARPDLSPALQSIHQGEPSLY